MRLETADRNFKHRCSDVADKRSTLAEGTESLQESRPARSERIEAARQNDSVSDISMTQQQCHKTILVINGLNHNNHKSEPVRARLRRMLVRMRRPLQKEEGSAGKRSQQR